MSGRFDGKVTLVTAAGQGIGRATAEAFAAEGAKVVAVDIAEETGSALVEELQGRGAEAIFVAADATDTRDVAAAVRVAVERFGGLDVAANVVGGVIGGHVPDLHELSETDWDRTVALVLRSCFLCLKHELGYMVGHGGGAIVNVVSVAGTRATATTASYAAAKAGVAQLTRVAAVRYGGRNIRVNAISPGVTRTPVVAERMDEARLEQSLSGHVVKRLAEPEEQAEAILWLASPAASMVTGHVLPVDGGWSVS